MTSAVLDVAPRRRLSAAAALRSAATLWFLTAVVGQALFFWFIAVHYMGPTLQGDFASWNSRDLITGHVPGDMMGNLAFALHVVVAGLITAAGVVQLIPQVRRAAPVFHRWNGRIYIAMAILMSLDGLWMVWVRGSYLNMLGAVASSLLAALTLVASVMALRTAMARRFADHNRWALRTFLLVGGVWFQRIGYMGWIVLNRGPVGMGKNLDGWFAISWAFGAFIVPLAVLELYLRARDGGGPAGKLAVTGLLGVCTMLTAIGSAAAYMILWKPAL